MSVSGGTDASPQSGIIKNRKCSKTTRQKESIASGFCMETDFVFFGCGKELIYSGGKLWCPLPSFRNGISPQFPPFLSFLFPFPSTD